jgi:hypothetical protein
MWRVLNQNFCVSLASIACSPACLPVASLIISGVINLLLVHVLEGVQWTCPQLVLVEGDSLQALLEDLTLVLEPHASCSGVGTRRDRLQGGGEVDNPIKFVHFQCLFVNGRKIEKAEQKWPVQAQTITWQAN